ncbi:MAG: hypothetical protein V1823_03135, partial [Chloroflexota bacterium]
MTLNIKQLIKRAKEYVEVDTHGHSPWHFTGQASLALNPGALAISRTHGFVSHPAQSQTQSSLAT